MLAMGNTPSERALRQQSSDLFYRAQQASRIGDFRTSRKLFTQSEFVESTLSAIENKITQPE
jgi:hypothetical protein